MARIQIYPPKSYEERLRKKPFEEQIKVSELKKKRRKAVPTAFEVLEGIKKLAKRAPKDLARNLDFYLYGGKRKNIR